MEQNVNPDILISKKDAVIIVETLLVKTLNFRQHYQKGTFHTRCFILGIFRVTVLTSKRFEKNIIGLYQKRLHHGCF